MKIIQQAHLRYTRETSDKIYEVDLCEIPGTDTERYIVNFRYGRYGSKLREGSKTTQAITLEEAQKVYDSLIVSKINKGYQKIERSAPSSKKSPLDAPTSQETDKSIHTTILRYLDSPPKNWPISRIIWRAGELKISAAADKIAAMAGSGDKPTDYAVTWSLGRCGNESHLSIIEKMQCSDEPSIQRLANDVYLILAPQYKRDEALRKVKSGLSNELQRCIDNDDSKELTQRLLASLSDSNPKNIPLLENMYTLATTYSCCHTATSEVLKTIPFREKNYFQAFRRLFKLSEFRQDSLIFSIITLRIETTAQGYWGEPFSESTRNYLRRRTWRTLRKLGEAKDEHYVDMANAILLSVSDEHSREARKVVRSEWNWDTQQTEIISTTFYDKFSDFLALNHILFQHSEQFALSDSRKSWQRLKEEPDQYRTEAFPELWDQRPEELLNLLIKSHCSIVHPFAVKALQDNTEFCQHIDINNIAQLLGSAYVETAAFALALAKNNYDAKQPNPTLITACLLSIYPPAREQAMQWLEEQPTLLRTELDLLAAIITSPIESVRHWLPTILHDIKLSSIEKRTLIDTVIPLLSNIPDSQLANSVNDISDMLLQHFSEELRQIDFAVIDTLLKNTNNNIQLLGAKLLLNHKISIESIPDDLLNIITQSHNQQIQGVGVSLLGKYNDRHLLKQHTLLTSYCLSEIAPIRLAVRPLIKRLADNYRDFGETLFQTLISQLFLAEPCEGFNKDLIELITNTLSKPFRSIDKNLRWRLLQAQSKGAQQLGAISLKDAAPSDYSIKQWTTFANNPNLSVRQWAMHTYTQNPRLIKTAAADALRILNSPWDDSRDFGIRYFRENFSKGDWNPSVIIGICDNTRDDIQRFGRELITEFFNDGDGVEYLSKLSQHPSQNVQLFTTQFLGSYATDNLERLQQLQPYFITVLSNVYRGRIAKDRITLFLLDEALKSEKAAMIVGNIFGRQSVTYSLTDKSIYIQGMCAIRDKYPNVQLPIQTKALPLKAHNNTQDAPHAI